MSNEKLSKLEQYNFLTDIQKEICNDYLNQAIENNVHLCVISDSISTKIQNYILALQFAYSLENMTELSVCEDYELDKDYLLNLSSIYFWLNTEYDIEQYYIFLISSIKLIELMKYNKDQGKCKESDM